MYSNIDDCDEGRFYGTTTHAGNHSLIRAVFNFWEPLHYLWKGYGFQTWETSPAYSIRSWAYILLQYLPVSISATFIGPEKASLVSPRRLRVLTGAPPPPEL